jgi:hypothetical protein
LDAKSPSKLVIELTYKITTTATTTLLGLQGHSAEVHGAIAAMHIIVQYYSERYSTMPHYTSTLLRYTPNVTRYFVVYTERYQILCNIAYAYAHVQPTVTQYGESRSSDSHRKRPLTSNLSRFVVDALY